MSHHVHSPLARSDNRLDIADQYVFRGERGTVFVLDVNSSLAGEDARPGFHPEARYEFRIHSDGAAIGELTYRVTFGDRDETGRQAIALHILKGSDAHDDSATGDLLVAGRTLSGISGPAGLRLWAGPARDPFYVDLRLVHAINTAVNNGTELDLDGWTPQYAHSQRGPRCSWRASVVPALRERKGRPHARLATEVMGFIVVTDQKTSGVPALNPLSALARRLTPPPAALGALRLHTVEREPSGAR